MSSFFPKSSRKRKVASSSSSSRNASSFAPTLIDARINERFELVPWNEIAAWLSCCDIVRLASTCVLIRARILRDLRVIDIASLCFRRVPPLSAAFVAGALAFATKCAALDVLRLQPDHLCQTGGLPAGEVRVRVARLEVANSLSVGGVDFAERACVVDLTSLLELSIGQWPLLSAGEIRRVLRSCPQLVRLSAGASVRLAIGSIPSLPQLTHLSLACPTVAPLTKWPDLWARLPRLSELAVPQKLLPIGALPPTLRVFRTIGSVEDGAEARLVGASVARQLRALHECAPQLEQLHLSLLVDANPTDTLTQLLPRLSLPHLHTLLFEFRDNAGSWSISADDWIDIGAALQLCRAASSSLAVVRVRTTRRFQGSATKTLLDV